MLTNTFDGIKDLVYIVDLETYEVLYANAACRQCFHIEDIRGRKCYEILQGLDRPCDFCTTSQLLEHGRWTWSCFNRLLQRRFDLYDSLIEYEGRTARLEIAYDTGSQTDDDQEAVPNRQGDIKCLLSHCARLLADISSTGDSCLGAVLEEVGRFLKADRCCLYEFHGHAARKAHSWYHEGNRFRNFPQRELPESLYARWLELMRSGSGVHLADVEEFAGVFPNEYALLKKLGIRSFLVEPLMVSSSLFGFLCVGNPDPDMLQTARLMLTSISQFMASAIERLHLMSTLEHYTCHDPLTGLGNRHLFQEKLHDLSAPGAAILLLEVNGLKKINETSGVQQGDALLVRIADMLREFAGDALPFRLNGGEFALLWPSIGEADFRAALERVQPFFSGPLGFSAAVGGHRQTDGETLRETYLRAERHMYQQKKEYYRRQGGSRYRAEMDDMLRLAQPGTLEQLLETGRFITYWQPKFRVDNGRICGVEVLVRLKEDNDIVAPGQFIPLLEALHRTYLLDFHVFGELCRFLRLWLDQGLPVVPVASNFSRHTFVMPDFLDRLEAIRARYDIPRSLLQVEITETVDAADHAAFQAMARRLHNNGFCLVIDDFGVAHANLATLAEVDFNVLKLDKRLVDSLENNDKLLAILKMLIATSRTLHITTVAEGVERQRQLDILSDMGCNEVQGFFLSRPLPVDEFRRRLTADARPDFRSACRPLGLH